MTSPPDHSTGKTKGMLRRLPHFYDPSMAGPLLVQFVDMFGRRLERGEVDLYRVLHAHHVETADNEGSKGFTAPAEKRGDLDKIFALYLESLGGTSQLIKLNPRFTVRSLDARRLARLLTDDAGHDAALAQLQPYLKKAFAPATWTLLEAYRVENTAFTADEITPGFALELLLGDAPVTEHIRAKLPPETQALLAAYGGGVVIDKALREALLDALNDIVLRDPSLFRTRHTYFEGLVLRQQVRDVLPTFSRKAAFPETTTLETRRLTRAWDLISSINKDFLGKAFLQDLKTAKDQRRRPPEENERLLALLAYAEPAAVPPGDDLKRLNRMLLEAAYPYDAETRPWGFAPRPMPSLQEVRAALVKEFNALLERDDLYHPNRFPDLEEDLPYLRKRYAGEPVWLNRILLEAAFPLTVEKSYAPYRERLRALLRVLQRGASTRQGVLDVVAANLGIVGEGPAAQAARERIMIEEYLPKQTWFFDGAVRLFEAFEITNTNPSQETPEIWVTMRWAGPDETPRTLANLRFVDTNTGRSVRFSGRMQTGDRLVLKGQTVLLNGIVPTEGMTGAIPVLPRDRSTWRLETDVVTLDEVAPEDEVQPPGRFDAETFGHAVFMEDDPVARVEVVSYQYTPGVFTVMIPWHIPGFTDTFEETEDHPRHQILTLVNRVKAAGVQALVAYHQTFEETHEITDGLRWVGRGRFPAAHAMEEAFEISSRQTNQEDHAVQDTLNVGGVFDHTRFDSSLLHGG